MSTPPPSSRAGVARAFAKSPYSSGHDREYDEYDDDDDDWTPATYPPTKPYERGGHAGEGGDEEDDGEDGEDGEDGDEYGEAKRWSRSQELDDDYGHGDNIDGIGCCPECGCDDEECRDCCLFAALDKVLRKTKKRTGFRVSTRTCFCTMVCVAILGLVHQMTSLGCRVGLCPGGCPSARDLLFANLKPSRCKKYHSLVGENRLEPEVRICLDDIRPPCHVLSFGIDYNFIFDDFMLKQGCTVWSFDPSMRPGDYSRHPTRHKVRLGGMGGMG